MYGTNIIQFISYFSQDAETCYKMLIEFVRNFANKHFIEKIDFADLELTRLDLCYNQFFNSKLDALTYLNKQKELLKKHARSTKNDYRSYETSLLYITKRYSFKIYHKGTEFRKNDRRELSKKNPTGHQIDDLQEISDKVLRYEITFRKAQINYLYEKAELYKNYIPYKTESELYFCRTLNRNLYERIVEFSTQSKHFIFAGISDDDALRLNTVAFSQAIFIEMYNYFWETVKKYQLGVKLSLFDVIKRIDEKNKEKQDIKDPRLREKLSYHKPTLSLLATLAQYESVDDIQKSGIFSRAQFYRYKKKLAELGISSENILTEMPPPALDFVDYKYYFSKHHIK
jgi:hypothetical protein